MHIVLVGDSILDNESYVGPEQAVRDLLCSEFPDSEVTLLAVDGAVTADIHNQLLDFPINATHVFFSCGGNDAIANADILDESVSVVEDALLLLAGARERFRADYASALKAVTSKNIQVAAFTIYNKVPELDAASVTALALFNEVILEELSSAQIPVIDLRVIFSDSRDYSPVSVIEPSVFGGHKIVKAMRRVVNADFKCGLYV